MSTFTWPSLPKTEANFEGLMHAIDEALAAEGVKPFQRPFHTAPKLWEAFKWEGAAFPDKRLADLSGYDGDVLMAKAYRWYEQTYGDKLKSDFAYGFAPARLGNALWRVRASVTYGAVRLFVDRSLQNRGKTFAGGRNPGPATYNLLCASRGFPKGWLTDFAKGGKNGHSLEHAAQLLKAKHGVVLSSAVLALAECSPAVRYGEVVSTEAQALAANHAVLGVLDKLRRSSSAAALIATYKAPSK